jgi:uncharacterized protein YuzE
MTVTIGQHTFDRVRYDAEGDVLALHKGEPSSAADFEESPEGDALRFNAAGELVGITILNARHRLERDGHVSITLPPQQLDAGHDTLDAALVAA